jgi:hypothetical protein
LYESIIALLSCVVAYANALTETETLDARKLKDLSKLDNNRSIEGQVALKNIRDQRTFGMRVRILTIAVACTLVLGGCSTISSSNPISATSVAAWSGPVLVSESQLPDRIQYRVVASVQVDARAGYESSTKLHPLLADEARKVGANAVVSVIDGRRLTAFSWSAPYVRGIAVRVKDAEALQGISGTYY